MAKNGYIAKEEMLALLSAAYSRKFGGSVAVLDFEGSVLSPPNNKKSEVYQIGQMRFDMPSGVVKVPPVAGFKVYRGNYEEEYETEKRILSLEDELRININGGVLSVYPEFYSKKVPECDARRVIIREFVNGPSLLELVHGKEKKGEKVQWQDINGTLREIALLHVYSPWIAGTYEDFPVSMDPEHIAKNFVKHFERLYYSATGKELSTEEEAEVHNIFEEVATRFLFHEDLVKIINGDLSACPHHATNDRLLDAGGTVKGFLTDDVSLYSIPTFSRVELDGQEMGIRRRGEKAMKEYLEHFKTYADALKFPDDLEKKIRFDYLMSSWFAASIRGNLRGASSILSFNSQHINPSFASRWFNALRPIEGPSWVPRPNETAELSQEDVEADINAYLSNLYTILNDVLKDDKDFSRIRGIIQKIPLPFKFHTSVTATRLDRHINPQPCKRESA